MISRATSDAIRDMPMGTHAILLYDTPERKREVLVNHLKHGVGKEGLFYAYDGERPRDVEAEMYRQGLEVDDLVRDNVLTIAPAVGVYLNGGEADIDRIYRGSSEIAWAYVRRGLAGARAAVDAAPLLRRGMTRELVLLEHILRRRLAFPGKGVCAHSPVALDALGKADLLMSLVLAHSMVIVAGPKGTFVMSPRGVQKAGLATALEGILPGLDAEGERAAPRRAPLELFWRPE